MSDRLFTPRFITMFCYSFTVFVSLFQLLPAAPYRILDLGGTTSVAGLFQGVLTFASAFSAAFTGPLVRSVGPSSRAHRGERHPDGRDGAATPSSRVTG